MRAITLSIFFRHKLVGSKTFRSERIFIGSDRRAQVRISHPSIALLHAVIERKTTKYVIADLESENGIQRNGVNVREAELVSGDKIKIGQYSLRIAIDDGKPKMAVQSTTVRGAAHPPRTLLESRRLLDETATDLQLPLEVPFAGIRQNPSRSLRPRPLDRPSLSRLPQSSPPVQSSAVFSRQNPQARKPHETVVQVSVRWGDRVLQLNHYRLFQSAKLGPRQSDDIVVPTPYATRSKVFLQVLPSGCQISLPDGATVEVASSRGRLNFESARSMGKVARRASGYILNVAQDDVLSLTFSENFKVFVRYVQSPAIRPSKPWRPFSAEQAVSWFGIALLVSTFAFWNARFESSPTSPIASASSASAQIVFQPAIETLVTEDPSLEVVAVDIPEPVAPPSAQKSSQAPTRSQTLLNKKNSRSHKQTVIASARVPMILQPGVFSAIVEKVSATGGFSEDAPTTRVRDFASVSGVGQDPQGVSEKPAAAIDHDGIRVAIEQILDRIKACYDRALVKRVNLEGQITVRFLIGAGGVVKSAQTRETTLHHAGVEKCVEGQIRRQKFPLPVEGTVAEIDYPFIFKRDQAPIFKSKSANRSEQPDP